MIERIVAVTVAVIVAVAVTVTVAASASASTTEPRAYLRSDSGFAQTEQLFIDGKPRRVSNFLMSTYDLADFDDIKEKNGEAWVALHNHNRYGVVGTRGFVGGLSAAAAALIATKGEVHWAIPATFLFAGFTYGFNCRHMAKHNLHKAINILNGVTELGYQKDFDINFSIQATAQGGFLNFAYEYRLGTK